MEVPLVGSVASGYGADSPQAPEMSYGENAKDLKKASRDFVSILFSYMFSSMRGNPDDNEDDDNENGDGGGKLFGGQNVQMFMGFLDQEVGKKFADQGGKNIVDALYFQLKGKTVYSDEKKQADEKVKVNNAAGNVIEKNKVI